jgi:hypothetical protein
MVLTRIAAAVVAAALIMGCAAESPAASSRNADGTACRQLADWENGSAVSNISQQSRLGARIEHTAPGSTFAADFATWINELKVGDMRDHQTWAATLSVKLP